MNRKTKLMSKEDIEDLGRGLLAWRLRTGKSQQEVADKLGMSRYTVSRTERGGDHVDDGTLYKIYAHLVRELNIERETVNAIDAHIVEKSAEIGRMKFDQEIKKEVKDWQLQKLPTTV